VRLAAPRRGPRCDTPACSLVAPFGEPPFCKSHDPPTPTMPWFEQGNRGDPMGLSALERVLYLLLIAAFLQAVLLAVGHV